MVVLRYFNIFGPGQKDHFISEFATRAIKGDYRIIGNDTRSLFVDDAVEISYKLIKRTSNQIINVGNESESKISDVAEIILDILGIDPKTKNITFSRGCERCPDIKNEKYNKF